MTLKKLEITGFKSFGKKATLFFDAPIVAIVGPNGSGKSNVAEAFRWVLGEQSLKSLRGKKGEDLIFNGSSQLGRLSRASVMVVFDNIERRFSNVDFDEVAISREVFRDGTNEYMINGSKVRLKDILELLAGVSLGPSGHHIISQGEADRLLNSNLAERRTMIEEALGLNIYQWKLQESEKKLAKTRENIREVEGLRREIAPHLKFLKKQVEKIEKANELRDELAILYRDYFKREEIYLAFRKNKIADELVSPEAAWEIIEAKLAAERNLPTQDGQIEEENKLREMESGLRRLRGQKDDLSRALGRLEGVLEFKEKEQQQQSAGPERVTISRHYLENLEQELTNDLTTAEGLDELSRLKDLLVRLREKINNFFEKYRIIHSNVLPVDNGLEKIREEKKLLENQLVAIEKDEQEKQTAYETAKWAMEESEKKTRIAEREVYELRARKSEVQATIEMLRAQERSRLIEEENFKRELGEATTLIGREILSYQDLTISINEVVSEEREKQDNRRRQVERLKIRLEDIGGENTEVLREHEEVSRRDEHLAKELDDLSASEKTLEEVMNELRGKIDLEFKDGLGKINKEFQKFFAVLFGGGTASLEVIGSASLSKGVARPEKEDLIGELLSDENLTDNDKEANYGIDISVSLPRKKIKGLAMLSGGERALTSIALLFAMSQVNPPPFLILDETDAALDEANSRKYGEMIANLGKYSQLILITHNRETMSHAGILYGVTMGADSVSRLISLKIEEAEQYAK